MKFYGGAPTCIHICEYGTSKAWYAHTKYLIPHSVTKDRNKDENKHYLGKQPLTRTEDIHVICYKAYCY